MRYVVDTSVGVKWFVAEAGHDHVLALLDDSVERVVPDLFFVEASNALRMKVTLGEISEKQAFSALAAAKGFFSEVVACQTMVQSALRLSLLLAHPAQDCFFLAVALEQGIPLVTADEKFASKLQNYSTTLIRLADFTLPSGPSGAPPTH